MSEIAIIPARGGSKGLPGKCTIDFAGKPLVAWTIAAAQEAGLARVIVSTDSAHIAEVAARYGAEVLARPKDLADDCSPMMPVVQHALQAFEVTTAVLLQPTSPLRSPHDIQAGVALHLETGRPVVSFTPAKPWLFSMSPDGTVASLIKVVDQRQAVADCVIPNGALYVASRAALLAGVSWWDNPIGYMMPVERSVDIDTQADLELALFYARKSDAQAC